MKSSSQLTFSITGLTLFAGSTTIYYNFSDEHEFLGYSLSQGARYGRWQ